MTATAASRKIDVAVVGATGLVGRAMLELLAERRFPFRSVHALALDGEIGNSVDFGEDTLDVESLADFDFSRVQLALFAVGTAVSAAQVPRAVAAGCVVIDNSDHYRRDAAVPLVVPEVNAAAIERYKATGIIANPTCSVTQMVVALQAIHAAVGIARINVASYQSVSGLGQAAVEELARQTAALLNARHHEPKVFAKQIAFNCLPQVDDLDIDGISVEERKMQDEVRRIWADDSIMVNATAVRVPVFYGHAQAVHLETCRPLALAEARRLLAAAAGVSVLDQPTVPGGWPTAVSEASGSDVVHVGRVRQDASHPRGLNLWVVADNVRRGSALNAVQIAEHLVRHHL